jgi:hypothetical protein
MDDNIKMNPEEIMLEECGLDATSLRQEPVGAPLNMKINSLTSTKAKTFLD